LERLRAKALLEVTQQRARGLVGVWVGARVVGLGLGLGLGLGVGFGLAERRRVEQLDRTLEQQHLGSG
jgi:hypothetical protein